MQSFLNILAIVGTVITVASFAYAVHTNREKARLEQLIQKQLAGLAGRIMLISKNPVLAHQNIDFLLQNVEQWCGVNKDLVNHAAWAQGDSTATHRMLEELLLDVLSFQEGLFGTREIAGTQELPTIAAALDTEERKAKTVIASNRKKYRVGRNESRDQ